MPEKRGDESLNSGSARKRIKLRDLDSICDLKSSSQQDHGLLVTKPEAASRYSSRGVQNQNGFSQDLEISGCHDNGDPIELADCTIDVLSSSLGEETKMQSITPGRNALSLLGAAASLSLSQVKEPLLRESKQGMFPVSSESAPQKVNNDSVSTQGSTGNGEQCFRSPVLISVDLTLRPPNICHDDMTDNVNASCQQEVSVRNQENLGCGRTWNSGKSKKVFDVDGKASECGSSAGSLDEADSLSVWKAMKQNGFVSSQFHAPLRKRLHESKPPLSKKVKTNLLKRNLELAKREQVNRFTKIAAPSGLLTGLNPGIINHVRNSKQVQSIIEALVKSEKLDSSQNQKSSISQIRAGTTATIGNEKDSGVEPDADCTSVFGSSAASHCFEDAPVNSPPKDQRKDNGGVSSSSLSENITFEREKLDKIACVETFVNTQLKYEDVKNALSMLLPPMQMSLETSSCVSAEDILTNQGNLIGLSVKAALVAHQWLELLSQDIKGRLAALKRSKKRIHTVVHHELPFIMSEEFSPDQENQQYNGRSSSAYGANSGLPDNHLEKWRSLFDQMDKALLDEGKQLERWLKQIKEMQLHCKRGLHGINKKSVEDLSGNTSRSMKDDTKDGEYAVRAAAASIYSTCNFAMSTENISCF